MSRVKPPPPGFRGIDKETGTGKPGGGPDPDGVQRSDCTGVIPCPAHDTLTIPPELIYGDRGVSAAPTDPDSALSSLAEVAERNGSAVAMIRHAADSAHYSTASWPGMGEWLTGNVSAIRTLADDLAAWCDTQTGTPTINGRS